MSARLVTDAGGEEALEAQPADRGRGLVPAVLATGLLAVFAGGWYYASGGWRTEQQIANGSEQQGAINGMVAQLASKMQQHPEDPEGWAMLGRSYFVLKRYGEAAQAYAEANSRAQKADPDWLTGQGEALGFARDRDLQGTPAQLFDKALAVDPDFSKALWYAGLAAAQAGDMKAAQVRWNKLLTQPDLPPQMREVITAHMQDIGGPAMASAGPSGAPPGPMAGAAAPDSAAAEAAAGGSEAAGTGAAPAGGVTLQLHITVDPQVAARAPQGAVLFVYAKAAQGPPMPLAVQRLPGATLPLDVKLDDSMAMAPMLRLSQFSDYAVTARLSSGGGALPQSGDLEGSLQASRAQSGQTLALNIDHVVP